MAEDPPGVYTCKQCGEPIVPGEEYLELYGDYYHMEECVEDAAVSLLLEKCGATKGVAAEEDLWE